jgi:diguanylate cyclase (GGDEF)-like protein
VSATAISALARVAERRFQSFSEAADSVLEVLESALPSGKIVLGQLDRDEGSYRVIDVRGDGFQGIDPGSSLPWVQNPGANGNGSGMLDPEYLRSLEVKSYLAVPLATSDGSNLGTLCAVGAETGLFDQSHVELLTLGGRLLTYEMESVRYRADLRRLTEKLRDPERTDPVTGLANRTSFMAAADREWHLSQRGTVVSWLLACEVHGLREVRESLGEAMADLILKDVSDALGATIRRTDHLGRIGDTGFATVLVGCKGSEGAAAFNARFQEAFGRVIASRPAQVAVTYGAVSLAEVESPEAALEAAGKAAQREGVPSA